MCLVHRNLLYNSVYLCTSIIGMHRLLELELFEDLVLKKIWRLRIGRVFVVYDAIRSPIVVRETCFHVGLEILGFEKN